MPRRQKKQIEPDASEPTTYEAPLNVLADNIQTMANLVARREARLSRGQRAIEMFTQTIGRPGFLYANTFLIFLWITLNIWSPRRPLDPPPFSGLALLIAVESLFVTGLVLITQNRQNAEADHRAHLDLQINLLSEREITKILSLLEELIHHHQPEREHDAELQGMKETADPEAMLAALEIAFDQATVDVENAFAPEEALDGAEAAEQRQGSDDR